MSTLNHGVKTRFGMCDSFFWIVCTLSVSIGQSSCHLSQKRSISAPLPAKCQQPFQQATPQRSGPPRARLFWFCFGSAFSVPFSLRAHNLLLIEPYKRNAIREKVTKKGSPGGPWGSWGVLGCPDTPLICPACM